MPSVVTVCGAGQPAIPDVASLQVKVIVGFVLFQPAALGAGDTVAVMAGAVLSRVMIAETLAVFPAMSVACLVIAWLPPLALTSTRLGQTAAPEPASLHENVTVTSELFQPAALAGGIAVAEIPGGVLSILSATLVLAVFPALSTACPLMT